jgi:hypothetical protein
VCYTQVLANKEKTCLDSAVGYHYQREAMVNR